jgi:K+-transporting ATPase KdpF subunit
VRFTRAPANDFKKEPAMEDFIVGLVALLLMVYLLVALIRPEKF